MNYKINDWVYTYLGRVPRSFYCQITKIEEEEYGIFRKLKRLVYTLQIPSQEWNLLKYDWEFAKTQSELDKK